MPRRAEKRQGRRDFGSIISHGTPTAPSFSAVWLEGGRKRRKRGFTTRTDAESHLARVRVELDDGTRRPGDPIMTPGVTVKQAIEAYGKYLDEKGLKAGPTAERLRRLRTFFVDETVLLSELTTSACVTFYDALRTRVSEKTGRQYSVDTHRNTLAEARMLAKWAVKKRWLRSSPVDDIEGKGKRRHGKAQLRIDEARNWMAKAAELADAGEGGAVAAMMTLLLGMRASEIVSRVVRDLDDDGRLLWIPDAKTEAGKRTLRVPDMLRPYLQRLVDGRKPEELIFGVHWRDWPREWVQAICEKAAVPLVCAHSMRGLHSTLAMDAGVTGHVVAASLGHESVSTTVQSYAQPQAVEGARQRRALRVLAGGVP
jgi:integrase